MEALMDAHFRNLTQMKQYETQSVILYRKLSEIQTRYQHARRSKQWQWVYRHHMRMLIVQGLMIAFQALSVRSSMHLLELEDMIAMREDAEDNGDEFGHVIDPEDYVMDRDGHMFDTDYMTDDDEESVNLDGEINDQLIDGESNDQANDQTDDQLTYEVADDAMIEDDGMTSGIHEIQQDDPMEQFPDRLHVVGNSVNQPESYNAESEEQMNGLENNIVDEQVEICNGRVPVAMDEHVTGSDHVVDAHDYGLSDQEETDSDDCISGFHGSNCSCCCSETEITVDEDDIDSNTDSNSELNESDFDLEMSDTEDELRELIDSDMITGNDELVESVPERTL